MNTQQRARAAAPHEAEQAFDVKGSVSLRRA